MMDVKVVLKSSVRLHKIFLLWALLCLSLYLAMPVQATDFGSRTIVTREGDTYDAIAMRELGSTEFGRLLAEYNQAEYLSLLSANQSVKIPYSAPPEAVSAFFAKGSSEVYPGGDVTSARALKAGDKVFVFDQIKTGADGFVSLQVASGSIINIQPNSLVMLSKLDCEADVQICEVIVDAAEGALSTQVRQRSEQPTDFTVTTPHASAAVRGTVFDVNVSKEKLLIGVTEGQVDVTAQSATTELPFGLGVKTLAGQPVGTPVALLGATSYRRLPPRVSPEDTLSWYSLVGAIQYSVTLGQDAAGNSVLYKQLENDSSHQIRNFPAAHYQMIVRGIDQEGFVGFRSAAGVNVVNLDTAIERIELEQVIEDGSFVVSPKTPSDSSTLYEVQVSLSEDFEEVSSVDVSGDGGMLTSAGNDPAYARARVIVSDDTVGSFGPTLKLSAQ